MHIVEYDKMNLEKWDVVYFQSFCTDQYADKMRIP